MTWLKDGLEFLAGIQTPKNPVTHEIHGEVYAVNEDGTLGDYIPERAPEYVKPTFNLSTLSGLAALYENELDDFDKTKVGFHVVDHLTVRLLSLKADEWGRRHVYAEAKHGVETAFRFGEFHAIEKFLIDLRSSFFWNEQTVIIQTILSNLSSGVTITLGDDGVSQQLEIKEGVLAKEKVTIPPEGIALIPWRTFRDVAPIESKFFLRLKGVKDDLPLAALYDIDQKWKLDTIHAIGEWLKKHIKDAKVIA